MKGYSFVIILSLIIVGLFVISSTAGASKVTSGLLIDWNYSTPSGALGDLGPYGWPGTVYNIVAATTPTGYGAKGFNGSSKIYAVVNNTFENCINPGDGATWQVMFQTYGKGATQYVLRDANNAKKIFLTATNQLEIDLEAANTTMFYGATSGFPALLNNTWYYLTVEYNGSYYWYNLKNASGWDYTYPAKPILTTLFNDSATNVFNVGYTTSSLNGSMAITRVYNRALSAAEVNQNWANDEYLMVNNSVSFAATDANVTKDNGSAYLRVNLGYASSSTVTVQYATGDSTAHAGTEYTATSGTLTFSPGETTKYIQVPISDDGTVWALRHNFTVTLSNPSAGTILGANAAYTVHLQNHGGFMWSWDDLYFQDWNSINWVFKKYGFNTTYYVEDPYVDTYLGGARILENPVNMSYLKLFQSRGDEIGIHTMNHYHAGQYINNNGYAAYWANEIQPEVNLFAANGINNWDFCYPYGWSATGDPVYGNASIDAFLAPTYFKNVRGTILINQSNNYSGFFYDWNGVVLENAWQVEHDANIAWTEGLMLQAVNNGDIICLYSHDATTDNGTTNSEMMSPQTLDTLLGYAASIGAKSYRAEDITGTPAVGYTMTVSFTEAPTTGTVPLSVVFTDTSNFSGESYLWNFGDGNTSTLQNPTNIYKAAGTYTVSETVTIGGSPFTTTQSVTITAAATPTPGLIGGVVDWSGLGSQLSGFGTLAGYLTGLILSVLPLLVCIIILAFILRYANVILGIIGDAMEGLRRML